MPVVKLDSTFCLTARCEQGKGKTVYRDKAVTGFALEVRSSGGATYYFIYSDPYGKIQTTKIARYGDITFDQAKKEAKRRLSEVTLGGDPAAKKKEKKNIPTYASLAAQHAEYAKTYQRCPSNTESVLRCHILPRWGKQRLNEITTQDIAKWFAEKIGHGLAPATIEKIRVVFSRSFELGRQWNIPGADQNPVRNVPRRRFKNARTKYLSTDDAKRLLKAAGESSNPQLQNIIGLLLLTGARKTELLRAQWLHIDLERKSWHIPTTKTGVPRYVPLSQAALDIINELPRWDGCPWLLPNPLTRKPYADLKRPWDTARDKAGLGDFHLHDLRHSAASFMINAGIDLYAVGRILGHADHQSTMRYSHLANETLMAAVEAGAAKMLGARLSIPNL
jgi:integrase